MEALTMCRFQHANGSYSHVGQQAPRLSTNTNCGNPNRHGRVSSTQKHFTWFLELEGNFSGSLDNVSFLILSLLTGRRWRRGGRQQQHPLRAMCIWRVHFIKPRYSLPRCDLQGSLKLSQTCCLFASKIISGSQRGLGHLLVSTVSRHHMSLRSHLHPHPYRAAPTRHCSI